MISAHTLQKFDIRMNLKQKMSNKRIPKFFLLFSSSNEKVMKYPNDKARKKNNKNGDFKKDRMT